MQINLKDYPQIRTMLKMLGYRRHTARLKFGTDGVELNDTYWDSGSRSTYHLVRICQSTAKHLGQHSPPQFGGQTPIEYFAPGQCIVRTGTFCGKPSHATIYISRSDAKTWFDAEEASHVEA